MKAYVFPGQASQYEGMGEKLYKELSLAKEMFERANEILGFRITDIMFAGTDEDLRRTEITQPAGFLHSVIMAAMLKTPGMVAGHSLGEFSALVTAEALSFEDGLRLVKKRAEAMQRACELEPSTMAAVLGLNDETVEEVLNTITEEVVVPANYNCDGQIIISGSLKGIEIASHKLGAKRVKLLPVGGAFHSPLMDPARFELAKAISETTFNRPSCPIYQNVDAKPTTDPAVIRDKLIRQLTSPVRWKETVLNMVTDGARTFIEVGPGEVLQNLIKSLIKKNDLKGIHVSGLSSLGDS